MSLGAQIILAIALLILISLVSYFFYRANKNDYTKKICTRCGSEKLTPEEVTVSNKRGKVIPTRCEDCGFISYDPPQ